MNPWKIIGIYYVGALDSRFTCYCSLDWFGRHLHLFIYIYIQYVYIYMIIYVYLPLKKKNIEKPVGSLELIWQEGLGPSRWAQKILRYCARQLGHQNQASGKRLLGWWIFESINTWVGTGVFVSAPSSSKFRKRVGFWKGHGKWEWQNVGLNVIERELARCILLLLIPFRPYHEKCILQKNWRAADGKIRWLLASGQRRLSSLMAKGLEIEESHRQHHDAAIYKDM